ncbi:hypothetical protein M427DRAFT_296136, partial [Gonapodya prolifera JEL478]
YYVSDTAFFPQYTGTYCSCATIYPSSVSTSSSTTQYSYGNLRLLFYDSTGELNFWISGTTNCYNGITLGRTSTASPGPGTSPTTSPSPIVPDPTPTDVTDYVFIFRMVGTGIGVFCVFIAIATFVRLRAQQRTARWLMARTMPVPPMQYVGGAPPALDSVSALGSGTWPV